MILEADLEFAIARSIADKEGVPSGVQTHVLTQESNKMLRAVLKRYLYEFSQSTDPKLLHNAETEAFLLDVIFTSTIVAVSIAPTTDEAILEATSDLVGTWDCNLPQNTEIPGQIGKFIEDSLVMPQFDFGKQEFDPLNSIHDTFTLSAATAWVARHGEFHQNCKLETNPGRKLHHPLALCATTVLIQTQMLRDFALLRKNPTSPGNATGIVSAEFDTGVAEIETLLNSAKVIRVVKAATAPIIDFDELHLATKDACILKDEIMHWAENHLLESGVDESDGVPLTGMPFDGNRNILQVRMMLERRPDIFEFDVGTSIYPLTGQPL